MAGTAGCVGPHARAMSKKTKRPLASVNILVIPGCSAVQPLAVPWKRVITAKADLRHHSERFVASAGCPELSDNIKLVQSAGCP